MKQEQTVEVIIPTYKPGAELTALVRKLLAQSVAPGRIHILNTRCGIFPTEILGLSEKITLTEIGKNEFDHGGTRHRGAMESEADFLLFMTQDAMPADEFLLERLLACFADSRTGAAYARQLPVAGATVLEAYTRTFNYPPKSLTKTKKDLPTLGIKTYFCSNVCAMYAKQDYLALGGFERKTIFNEDMLFAYKLIQAGKSIVYAASAQVYHSHHYTCLQQFRRNFDLAVSQVDHPEVFLGVSSEGEGIRLVKQTAGYLRKQGKIHLLFPLFFQSGAKYAGYICGKHYRKLPMKIVKKISANPYYWES